MKNLFLSFIIIAGFGFSILQATNSLFSDVETSTGNTLVAGALDLKIDNTSYYNGKANEGTTWTLDNLPGHLFFNFLDLKPSDDGEDTISFHTENDSWLCADLTLTEDDDETCTEPELLDDLTCAEPNEEAFDGELADNLNFVFWEDDGDNVFETDEGVIAEGSASAVLSRTNWTLADSQTNNLGDSNGRPLPGGRTRYIAKAWCFGTLTKQPVTEGLGVDPTVASGILCDGSGLNNETQTDVIKGDITFRAVQARHNPDFVCGPNGTPPPSTPPLACGKADVMLVLDRSGSISRGEFTSLKTAAKDFVDALALAPDGVHAGQSSFATFGTLDHILTSNAVSLKAAIDALNNGGFTNLKEGLDIASVELAGGNDRSDVESPDNMIVITDGHPNRPLPSNTADDLALAAADAAKAGGTTIYVVGVGSDVDAGYLADVASPGHYYSVSDYANLQALLQTLTQCEEN